MLRTPGQYQYYESITKRGTKKVATENKEPLFFLHSISLPAALRITSYEEGMCARKVNPLLDQSEHYLKRLFQQSFQDV